MYISLKTTIIITSFLFLSSCATMNSKENVDTSRTAKVNTVSSDAPEMINVNLGVGYLKRNTEKDLEVAIGKFKKALTINPKFALAHSMLANAYDRKKLFDSAEAHYKKSMKYNNGNPDIINNYANFMCQRGKYQKAIKYYEKVFTNSQYKTPESAYENAGVCAMKGESEEQAEAFFREALKINNKLPNSLYYLMTINIKQQNFMKARAFLQRLEGVVQHSPEILAAGYNIETGLNHTGLANNYLKTLKSKYPNSDVLRSIQREE